MARNKTSLVFLFLLTIVFANRLHSSDKTTRRDTDVDANGARRDEDANRTSSSFDLPDHHHSSSSSSSSSGKMNVGCRGLRSKRYISDGFCRTLKPISEVLCTGYCVPERYLPWYPEFIQAWSKAKVMEYRCVDGVVRHQKVKLMCDNGKVRVYKVKVVKSCACRKQQVRYHHQYVGGRGFDSSSVTSASSSSMLINESPPSRREGVKQLKEGQMKEKELDPMEMTDAGWKKKKTERKENQGRRRPHQHHKKHSRPPSND